MSVLLQAANPAAWAIQLLDDVNPKAGAGQAGRGCDAADAGADHEDGGFFGIHAQLGSQLSLRSGG